MAGQGPKERRLATLVCDGLAGSGRVIWVDVTLKMILFVKDERARVLFRNTANKPLLSHKRS
jgi:hypothetical protein